MKNISDKSCRENLKTHFMSNNFVWKSCLFEEMWKNVGQGRSQMTCLMRIACWIPWAMKTHSQYAILIAFPLQQWLRKRASVLRCTYVPSLIIIFGLPETMALSLGMAWYRATDLTTFSASLAAPNFLVPVRQSVQVSKLVDRSTSKNIAIQLQAKCSKIKIFHFLPKI